MAKFSSQIVASILIGIASCAACQSTAQERSSTEARAFARICLSEDATFDSALVNTVEPNASDALLLEGYVCSEKMSDGACQFRRIDFDQSGAWHAFVGVGNLHIDGSDVARCSYVGSRETTGVGFVLELVDGLGATPISVETKDFTNRAKLEFTRYDRRWLILVEFDTDEEALGFMATSFEIPIP